MAKRRKLKNAVISGTSVAAAGIGLAAVLMVGSGSRIPWIAIGVCGAWIILFLLANADE